MSADLFELRFDGPKDDSAVTLRQIKGVFVADLEFPISDVQHFIESAPIVVKKAESEAELSEAFNLLEKAGAKVLIVNRKNEPAPLELEFEEVLDQPMTELVQDDEVAPLVLDLSLEDSPALEDPQPEVNTPQTSLSFDNLELTVDSEELGQSFSDELKIEEITPEIIETDSIAKEDSFELDLFQPEESTLLSTETETQQPQILTEPEIHQEPETLQQVAQEPLAERPEEKIEEYPVQEITLEELKALQAPIKKRKSHYNIKLAGAFLLCVAVLAYINSIVFSAGEYKNPFDSIMAGIPQMPEENTAKKQKIAEPENTSWQTAEMVFADRSYKASVWVENKIPLHASIELNAPKPAPLSKEEIVNNVPERIWLKRIEIKDLIFRKDGEKFIAEGPAFAYLYASKRNIRLADKAFLEAAVNPENGEIALNVKAGSEPDGNSDSQLSFGLSGQNASAADYFFYTENILIPKPGN